MRILICDDDTLIIEQLQKYIESYFESNHLKCPELVSFTSGESLLADKNEKDIVFLDIEMPGMNGIYVGNELKKANKNVIIFVVTSYSEYLDEAMRFHVFRYLSKPLDKQRFFRNMKDALAYYNSITTKIPVETKLGVYSFPASQIIAIEAQGRKVIVHSATVAERGTSHSYFAGRWLPWQTGCSASGRRTWTGRAGALYIFSEFFSDGCVSFQQVLTGHAGFTCRTT